MTVRIGTAGWSYPDWQGIVYPPSRGKGFHGLSLLASWFDTVEINASFYHPLRPQQAESWLPRVAANDTFRFTGKLWQRFTHDISGAWPGDEALDGAVAGFLPLREAGRFGALLIQFPWSFRRTPENRTWLARLVAGLAGWPLCVEVRHASWDVEEVYTGMRERAVAFCTVDQPLFPGSLLPCEVVTAPMAYVRLHGRNREDWFREEAGRDQRYNYLYSADEVHEWSERIGRIREVAKDVYVITNNHFQGQAVANALELQAGLTGRTPRIPDELLARYPRLRVLSDR